MGRGEKREDKRGERGGRLSSCGGVMSGGVATAVRSAFPLFVLPVFCVRRRPPSLCPLRSLPWCVLWWRFVALPSMPPCPYCASLRDGTNNVTPSAEGCPPFLTALNALRAADTEGDKSYRRGYACGY